MTQKAIAEILNISRSTVSLALSGSSRVNSKTRKMVVELAKKINYQPNLAARSLVSKKSNLVGVLLPSFEHNFLGELSDEIFQSLYSKGYFAFYGVGSDEQKRSDILSTMESRNVDGIISYSANWDINRLIRLRESGLPLVTYRRPNCDYPISYVDVDRFKGVEMLVDHLYEEGCRRIAFVGLVLKENCYDRRFLGYQSAMKKNSLKIEDSLVVNIDGEFKDGVMGFRALMERSGSKIPDAIVFHNDSMAMGAIGEALRVGLKVPRDIAIVGFDDLKESAYYTVQLTTIRQPRKQIADKLVELLIEQIEGENSHIVKDYIFEPELLIRESSLKSCPGTD